MASNLSRPQFRPLVEATLPKNLKSTSPRSWRKETNFSPWVIRYPSERSSSHLPPAGASQTQSSDSERRTKYELLEGGMLGACGRTGAGLAGHVFLAGTETDLARAITLLHQGDCSDHNTN